MVLAPSPTPADDLAAMLTRPFYSPAEVAEIAGVSSSTILNYIHAGRLIAVQLSERTYRVPRKAVLRLLGAPVAQPQVIEDRSQEAELQAAEPDG
jgi:excisionase family DNA binding protein